MRHIECLSLLTLIVAGCGGTAAPISETGPQPGRVEALDPVTSPPAVGAAPGPGGPAVQSCDWPGLVVGPVAPRKIGTLADVARAAGKEIARDEEALDALCPTRTALCDSGMRTYASTVGAAASLAFTVFALTPGGTWVAFDRVTPATADDALIGIATDRGGRYETVTIGGDMTVMGYQCEEGGGCELDSERFGARAVSIVVDLETPAIAFLSESVVYGADASCEAYSSPSRGDDDAWTRSDCTGRQDVIPASALAACTPERYHRWRTEADKRYAAALKVAKSALDARAR